MVEKSKSKPGECWKSGNWASEQSSNRENMLNTVRKRCYCRHSDRLVLYFYPYLYCNYFQLISVTVLY